MSPFDFTLSLFIFFFFPSNFFFFFVSHVAFWRCARACPNVIKENNYDNKIRNWGKGVAFLKQAFCCPVCCVMYSLWPAGSLGATPAKCVWFQLWPLALEVSFDFTSMCQFRVCILRSAPPPFVGYYPQAGVASFVRLLSKDATTSWLLYCCSPGVTTLLLTNPANFVVVY